MAITIPVMLFLTRIGLNVTFQTTYFASFCDNMIFPFYKRVTAIGICQLVARGLTITSSLCAKLPRPWPAVLLISVTGVALIDAIFLPSYSSEVEFEEKRKQMAEEA